MKLLSTADVITIHDECFLITAIKPSRRNGTCLMEHLRCVVERITYQNPQNGYSVIKCRAKGYSDLVTVVGAIR
jgi:hypothetical protein